MNIQTVITKDECKLKPARRINQVADRVAREARSAVDGLSRAHWLSSDQLTVLGLGAQIGAGVGYALSRYNRYALLLVILCLVLNWFGDSMDGHWPAYVASSARAMASMSITWWTSSDLSR